MSLLPPFPSSPSFSLSSPSRHLSPFSFPLPIPPISSSSNPTFFFSFFFFFSSSNLTYKTFNAILPLYANLYNPALPLHNGSLHLHPFLTGDPSIPLLPILLTSFSSPSSFSLLFPSPLIPPFSFSSSSSNHIILLLFFPLLQLHHSPLPSQPFFSSSSSNPTHKAFNVAFPLYTNLRDSTLPSHDSSLHLYHFLTGNPSFPSYLASSPHPHPSPSSFPPLLLPPSIPSFSSSSFSSFNNIQKAFNTILSFHDSSFHLHPFPTSDPSYIRNIFVH